MRVEVISAFRADGRIYQVGDVVDLPDSRAAALMWSRRVREAPPPPKRARVNRKKQAESDPGE